MPKYFFHIMNGKTAIDTIGMELPDMNRVRKEAIRASGQMISDGEVSWKGQAWQMIVADESDVIVFSVSFSVDRHGL